MVQRDSSRLSRLVLGLRIFFTRSPAASLASEVSSFVVSAALRALIPEVESGRDAFRAPCTNWLGIHLGLIAAEPIVEWDD
jgi:hypothetical protein